MWDSIVHHPVWNHPAWELLGVYWRIIQLAAAGVVVYMVDRLGRGVIAALKKRK